MVAHRLCRHMDRTDLTEDERAEAHRILRVMARDAAEQVRRALAVTLKASPLVPRDVANRLARDIESIAVPMLNFSPVFSDEDLAEIVRVGGPVRQGAVARRPVLTETVTGAIAEYGAPEAVRTAAENKGAAFTEKGLQTAIERFEASETRAGRHRAAQRLAGLGHRAAGDAGLGRAARAPDRRPRRDAADRAGAGDRRARTGQPRPGRAGRPRGRPAGVRRPPAPRPAAHRLAAAARRSRTAT